MNSLKSGSHEQYVKKRFKKNKQMRFQCPHFLTSEPIAEYFTIYIMYYCAFAPKILGSLLHR